MSDSELKEKEQLGPDAENIDGGISPGEQAELDQIESGISDDSDDGGLYSPDTKGKKRWIRSVRRRRVVVVGGLTAASGLSVVGLILFLFPILKLESYMARIEQRAFVYVASAVEQRASFLFERYMIKHVINLDSCGNVVNNFCKDPINGEAGLTAGLYRTWRDVKIEERLFDDFGLQIESNRNPDINTPGAERYTITDRFDRQIKLTNGDLMSGRFSGGSNELGRDLRKFIKQETKFNQVIKRRNIRIYLDKKHGINYYCFLLCKNRDNIDGKISSAKTRFKYKLTERVVYPFSTKYGLILDCITSGSGPGKGRCSKDSLNERDIDRSQLPDADIEEILNEFDPDFEFLDDAGDKVVRKGNPNARISEVVLRRMINKIIKNETRNQIANKSISAIPVAGQIYFVASVAQMLDQLDNFVDNNGFSQIAADLNKAQYLEYYVALNSTRDEIKSSSLPLDDIGAVNDNFSGAEQSKIYQATTPSSQVSSIFNSTVLAAADEYKCANDKPIPDGQLVCEEKKVARTYAVQDIRNDENYKRLFDFINVYDDCAIAPPIIGGLYKGPCPITYKTVIDKVLGAIGYISEATIGKVLNVALSLPGIKQAYENTVDFVASYLKDAIGFFLKNIFPLVIDPDDPGREMYDALEAGGEIAGADFAQGGVDDAGSSYGLGAPELTPEESQAILDDYQVQLAYEQQDLNVFERATNLENPNSFANRFINSVPSGEQGLSSSFASLFSNLFNVFGLLGNFSTTQVGAAPLAQSPFGITRFGYAPNNPNITIDPNILDEEYCAPDGPAQKAWEDSVIKDEVTGFEEAQLANPCLLEEIAADALGAYFLDE